jgi:hypothetical protein
MGVMEYFSRFGRAIAELLNITDLFKDPELYAPFGMSIFLLMFFVFFGWICLRKVRGARKTLRKFAAERGLSFSARGRRIMSADYFRFPLFQRGRARGVKNVFKGQYDGSDFILFDYWYNKNDMTHNYLVAVVPTTGSLPDFELRPESIPDKIRDKFGKKDIDIEADPAFSRKYRLLGADAAAVRDLFREDLRRILTQLDRNEIGGVEGGGHWLVFYQWTADYMSRKSEQYVEDIRRCLDNAFRIFEAFQNGTID